MTFSVLYDILVALAIFLAGLGIGEWGVRALRLEVQGAARGWLTTTAGLGVLSVGTLLLGLTGLLSGPLFALLLAPAVASGLWWLWREDRGVMVALWEWLQLRGASPRFRGVATLLLALSLLTVLWIVLTHALMPPHEWDEIAYHLALPKLYAEMGQISPLPYIMPSYYPMNNDMLFLIGLLWGSELASHFVVLGMTTLTAAGIALLAHRYWDDRVGVVAVALFWVVPLVKRTAGIGLIDICLGLYVLGALWSFARWQETRGGAWLVLCGAMCGFVAGSKVLGSGFLLLFGLLLLWDLLRRRPHPARAAASLLLFGVAGVLSAGPWYLRTFLDTGNPVWPFAYSIFGGRWWDALGDEYQIALLHEAWSLALPATPMGLARSLWYTLTRPVEMGGFVGGIGVVLPIGGLLVLPLVRRMPRLFGQMLWLAWGFYLLWFLLVSLNLRYLLPIVPLLALTTAAGALWLYDRLDRPVLQVVLLLLLALLVAREVPWLKAGERDLFASRLPYLQGEISRESWLAGQIGPLDLMEQANKNLPPDARLLLLPYETRGYYLERDYIWGNVFGQRIIRFEQYDSAEALAQALSQMGITHVLDVEQGPFPGHRFWEHDRALMRELQAQCGRSLVAREGAILYAIIPCTNGESNGSPSPATE